MAKITYDDKVTLNPQPSVANINKTTASDMNEIKQVVNENDDTVQEIINGEVYSTSEVKTNKVWIDGKPIYRKVLSGTLPTGTGGNSFFISNSEIISVNGFVKSTYGQWWSINNYFSEQKYSINCRLSENRNEIVLECGAFYNTSSKYFLIVEYTKKTD